MYSFAISKGNYGRISLNGLHFAGVDTHDGRLLYIDNKADVGQRDALTRVGTRVLELDAAPSFYSEQSMMHIETVFENILQEWDSVGAHVRLGTDGEFQARYIIGRDGVHPIVIKNISSWDIAESTKGTTSVLRYHRGPVEFSASGSNSNEGAFEYSSRDSIVIHRGHCRE